MRWYLAGCLIVAVALVVDIWVDFVDYRLAANISLIYISALVTAFAVLYGIRSRWWTNRIGKVFFVKSVTFSVVLWLITLQNWWDIDWPGRQHVRFVVYTLGAVAYLPMVVTLWREQQRDREPDRDQ